ncbi:unnamed protein product [Aureobasidium mustum]|uniref:Uncharacterized protein n=1 Tax=Aureobasidium mustum TaxID=2773714 RepID=A0A9N8PMA1_9PEZI|nr:unnamed protein product [Aureobasidium mustum]
MSTRQTRSKSRGRAVRTPVRPLSRVRTNTSFSDPDYDQPTPEPKTASTPSPTWGKLPDEKNVVRKFEVPTGTPSVSLIRPDGRRYYMSSACGPVNYSSTGKFQDPVARSNASRAKAMVYPNFHEPSRPYPNPNFPRRSASRPKRVEISTGLDEDEEERLRASPTWRKKRPDTPTFARATMFGSPKNSFLHWLGGFVPRSGFVWLVLIFFGILLGLSTPPETNPVQVAYKEVCSRFGNPADWNCNGNFNVTIDNVVSHCHSAADTIYDKLHMTGAKTNVEDLVNSCQESIEYRKDKLRNMFEGMETATATFKKSLLSKIKDLELKYTLALAKAEIKMLQDNDTSIVSHTTYTKRHLNTLLTTAWDLQKEIDKFSICMIRESEAAISELSKKISFQPESWYSLARSGWTVTSADSAFKALGSPSTECQTFLVRTHQKVLGALETREGLLREIERVINLSYHRDFRKKSPLYIPIPLPWVRALGPFPNLPVIPLPTIRLNPWYWFRGETYWYKVRTHEQREQSLKLHRLRVTLNQIREASEGFDDIKNLTERAIVSLLDAHKDLQSRSQEVLKNPAFGTSFLKSKIQTVREDLALAIKLRDQRKRVKNHINAVVWGRYNNGNDQHAVYVVREMRL